MHKELRRVVIVVFAMFATLFISSSTIQVLAADGYNADSRNVRSLYDSYKTKRGAILVDGQPIAESLASADSFHYQRQYTDEMYSAITGFFSLYQGATGLESSMNSYLSGKNSSQFFEQINALLSGNPVAGGSVELTIDPVAQKAAWKAMGKLKGAVVAIEPKTGKILAFVSKPGFDANLLASHLGKESNENYARLLADAGKPLINRTISGDLYAPGSIFKVIVASAAIESGQFTPESKIPNPKKYRLPGTNTYIYNSGEGKCGGKTSVTIADALRLSCNIPFAQLGVALGQDRIRAQAEIFGFGKKISMPMTATPSNYPSDMNDAQTALSAFGQYEDRVTPLQMAMVSAAIANGGIEMQPTIVENVQSSSLALLFQPQPQIFAQPVKPETAALVKKMMIGAVQNGVSSNGRIKGITVAGKTGTAQNGGNRPYTLWFTGFAPADNPKVAIAVVIEDGGGMGQSGFGNLLAAPVARKVMEAVLRK